MSSISARLGAFATASVLWVASIALTALIFTACATPDQESAPGGSNPPATMEEGYDPDARLAELGIVLTEPGPPVANYVNAVRSGNLLFLAGKGPSLPEGGYVTGKLGADLTVEQGYEAARLTAIQHLAVLKAELGNLNRVRRIVKVTGMVNATPEFGEQPAVVNGYSDLLGEVFGDRSLHARSAVGVGSLPFGIAVEVETIVEVE